MCCCDNYHRRSAAMPVDLPCHSKKIMFGNLLKLFQSDKTDFQALLREGAVIIDVRTPKEFAGGHIEGSLNIPLNTLPSALKKIKKEKPVITCCASGMRSASAEKILRANGFTKVYDAGSWVSLHRKIR